MESKVVFEGKLSSDRDDGGRRRNFFLLAQLDNTDLLNII